MNRTNTTPPIGGLRIVVDDSTKDISKRRFEEEMGNHGYNQLISFKEYLHHITQVRPSLAQMPYLPVDCPEPMRMQLGEHNPPLSQA